MCINMTMEQDRKKILSTRNCQETMNSKFLKIRGTNAEKQL